ncbi:MAG: hypothetical protein ACRCYY_05145 [Trueperaceae bacterium]
MRWLRVVCVLFSLCFMFSTAFAQENFISRTLDADVWLEEIEAGVALYSPAIIGIARNIALLGLVCAMMLYFLRPSPFTLLSTLLRALLVSALLILTPQITTLAMTTAEGLHTWSMNQLQPSLDDGAAELRQLGIDTGVAMTALTLPEAGLAYATSKTASALTLREAGVLAQGFERWLNFAVIPIIVCVIIVYLMGLLALLSVAVANIFFPLAAAMLMFSPANGEKWLGNYISAVVSAIFILLLLPLAFRVGFDIIVVGPVQTINENFAGFEDVFQNGFNPPEVADIDAQLQNLYAQQDAIIDDCWDNNDPNCSQDSEALTEYDALEAQIATLRNERKASTGNWWEQFAHTAVTAFQGAMAEIKAWLLRLLLLVIGSILASYLIWRVSSVVAGLVGGVALEAVHFASAPLGALSSAGRGLQGGVRDTSRRMDQRSDRQLDNGSTPTPSGGSGSNSPTSSKTLAGPSTGGGRVTNSSSTTPRNATPKGSS